MKKVIFLGGKEIGVFCLSHIIELRQELGYELIGVVPNSNSLLSKDDRTIDLAKKHGIQVLNSIDIQVLKEVDYLVSVQYDTILDEAQISSVKKLALNLHMAPLPEYRGCNQFSFAIIDGVSEFGTSIHRLDPVIDGGDLICENRFEMDDELFVRELYDQTVQQSKTLFAAKWTEIISDRYELTPQSELTNRKSGFHLRKEINDIKRIQKSWPLEKQLRYFRATYFPPFSPPVLVDGEEVLQELDMDWYNSNRA